MDSAFSVMAKNRNVTFTASGVEKTFDNYEWFLLEKNAYLMLHKIINRELVSEGWIIQSPGILNADQVNKSLLLEFLSGNTLDFLIKNKNMIPWFQIGEALAVFHSRSKVGENFVYLYADIGVGNIMVDSGNKSISFIDPGVNFGRKGQALSDVFLLTWAIFSARIRHGRKLSCVEKQFFDGWYSYSMRRNSSLLNCLDSASAVDSVEKILKERRVNKGIIKKVGSFFVFLIWKIIWVPLHMRKFLLPYSIPEK